MSQDALLVTTLLCGEGWLGAPSSDEEERQAATVSPLLPWTRSGSQPAAGQRLLLRGKGDSEPPEAAGAGSGSGAKLAFARVGTPQSVSVLLSLLATAASDDQPRWPLVIMMAAGVAILRWRRTIGRGIGSLYGTEFPRNPDPAPSRAKKEMAQMFWSLGCS
jgi:hypothetical protein